MRRGTISRDTAETKIAVEIDLDGTGAYEVSTGIGFLDHMIEQLSRHSLIDIKLNVAGDLHVDQHHTTEDSALAFGQALNQALAGKGAAAGGRGMRAGHAPIMHTAGLAPQVPLQPVVDGGGGDRGATAFPVVGAPGPRGRMGHRGKRRGEHRGT